MSFNLVDSVKNLFTPDLISKAASSLGESEGGISKALSGLVPTVLGGIVSKAGSGAEGAGNILNMAKDAVSSGITRNLGSLFGSGGGGTGGMMGGLSSGLDAIKGLFGNKLGEITRTISGFAGIKESSASSLMSSAAPAVLGVVGQHAAENNLSANGLASMLNDQKQNIMSALPSGLGSLGSLLGLGSIGAAISSAAGGARQMAGSAAHSAEMAVEKAGGGMRWLLPLFLALLVILLVWYFSKGCGNAANTTATMDTAAQTKTDTGMNMNTGPVSIKVKLPDGTELDAYKGGIEDMLVTYLNSTDPADSISKMRWFDFDNLNFKTGSDELTDESMKQVQNIAAILKAYPKVKIKIGGYTDKTGNEQDNMKLSQKRADAVSGALKKTGSNEAQLAGAEGYGSQFAKAAATAPDSERKMDRRISINVREK